MDAAILTALIAACAAVVGGIVSGVFSLVLQKAKHRDEREDKAEDEQTEWQKSVDDRLESHKRSIRELQRRMDDAEDMNRLELEGIVYLIRSHLDGNHKSDLEAYLDKVNKRLIERI